jgi:uncharacterized protein YdeI (YjbR/CyaY-like superfamily)
MAPELPNLEIATRERWRAWLEKHHTSSSGVWLVFYKAHTGRRLIPYQDAVREALCFGWIDSLIKRVDDERYVIKITPRKPTSKWSELNRRRWRELDAAGRLTPAGRAAGPSANRYADKPTIPELPAYIAKAFRQNAKAWAAFKALAPSHRRHYVAWIHIAKRPETRESRIRQSIELLATGKKLGLK